MKAWTCVWRNGQKVCLKAKKENSRVLGLEAVLLSEGAPGAYPCLSACLEPRLPGFTPSLSLLSMRWRQQLCLAAVEGTGELMDLKVHVRLTRLHTACKCRHLEDSHSAITQESYLVRMLNRKQASQYCRKALSPCGASWPFLSLDPLWLQGYPCFSMKLMGRPRRCVWCPAGPRSARPQQSRQGRVWAQQALGGWLTEEQMKCSKWQCKNSNKSLTMSCFKSALSAGFFIKLKGRKTGWAVACCWF